MIVPGCSEILAICSSCAIPLSKLNCHQQQTSDISEDMERAQQYVADSEPIKVGSTGILHGNFLHAFQKGTCGLLHPSMPSDWM